MFHCSQINWPTQSTVMGSVRMNEFISKFNMLISRSPEHRMADVVANQIKISMAIKLNNVLKFHFQFEALFHGLNYIFHLSIRIRLNSTEKNWKKKITQK